MRRLLAKLVRHRVSQLGMVLAAASGCVFLGLVVLHLRGFHQNPYADIVVVVVLPTLFGLGLLLMVGAFGCSAGASEPGASAKRPGRKLI